MPTEDKVAALLGAHGEFPEQARLADPRFTDQLDRARAASIELAEDLLERRELVGTPDEVLGKQAMFLL